MPPLDDGLTDEEIFDGSDDDPDLDISGVIEDDDDEDLHLQEEERHKARDASDENLRRIAREEAAALTDADRAQRMIDDFNGSASETEKALIDVYLDPERGTKAVKSGIEKLRAKAQQLDSVAEAKIAESQGRQDARSAFRSTIAPPAVPPPPDDEHQKDFDIVATGGPDAEEAQKRMIKRKMSDWAPAQIKSVDELR